MEFFIDRVVSPLGTVLLVSDGQCLRALDFDDYEPRMQQLLARYYGEVSLRPASDPGAASTAVKAYFAGKLNALDNIPVASHGSAFQQQVWRSLRDIPCGTTISYGELAKRIGNPAASRAVGLANGANPIAIAVPCHRVIGANGSLTGYGGGMERKRWLLKHEGALLL